MQDGLSERRIDDDRYDVAPFGAPQQEMKDLMALVNNRAKIGPIPITTFHRR